MHAIILSTQSTTAGVLQTTRLPPPLLPLVDRPVLAFSIERLVRQGVRRQLVLAGEHAAALSGAFGDGTRWGARMRILGQASRPEYADALHAFLAETADGILLLAADSLLSFELLAAEAFHRSHNQPLTLIPAHDRTQQRMAAAIVQPALLTQLATRQPDSLETLLASLQTSAETRVFAQIGQLTSLDTAAAYLAAQREILDQSSKQKPEPASEQHHPALAGRRMAEGIWVGRNDAIHPSVRIAGPVWIGESCRIARNVEIGPDVVIGNGCVIDEDATIRDSSILPNSYVGRLVDLTGRIVDGPTVIDAETGSVAEVTDPFLLTSTVANRTTSTQNRLSGWMQRHLARTK